ncbi:MAG TPA: TraB/GumN family protein [Chitinophagaceae bacterium]|nr:TraB/GumN family protein [Chitinophagaceae bacterium]
MNRFLLLIPMLLFTSFSIGQAKIKGKKYPSVFWEISGNGLKKPSYLFGTMHVSSKLAFQLSDSFYVAIRNAEVIALENNPESWQEDMNEYNLGAYDEYSPGQNGLYAEMPQDYFNIQSLRIGKYEEKLELALFIKPAVINNLLYRSFSESGSDFEEDTYLDLYIYQTGKRLGKRIAGVEEYAESMRLMEEAYKDAAKDFNKKDKSFDYDEEYSPSKLQDAYRSGDLDRLDSINKLNSQSEAFDEKFLYQRNEIQANSIDSILKKFSLFVGVGAAHLPGERGVIELLRKKGYRLRPIFMGNRDSRHKEALERVRVPVSFSTQISGDGFFKVDVPGKLFRYESGLIDQQQYADMANGSFYMVTRIKTNSRFWGHDVNMVAKKIDSVLYENVPGKILSKTRISRNGYQGFDITNRTRRGDFQRYHILITPFEVLFFRMGGNGDYVRDGDEAKKFFNSIRLKEEKNGGWNRFQPAYGGFRVEFPNQPHESIGRLMHYEAVDKSTNTQFSVLRTDIHNYYFAEEDTFDLNLMDESFASSEFISQRLERKQFIFKGFPALDCRYLHKDGSVFINRYIIQGPHYYTLVTNGKNENESMNRFLNSFEIIPLVYKELLQRKDSVLSFSVVTTWFPDLKKEKKELVDEYSYMEEQRNEEEYADEENYKSRLLKNDTTGEAIFIRFYRSPKYFYTEDSTSIEENKEWMAVSGDSSWMIRSKKRFEMKDKTKVVEMMVSDSNSSRVIRTRSFYKNGIGFLLMTQTDTLTTPSSFIKSFFENFSPADTLKGHNPFIKKSAIFLSDFFSSDSAIRNRAVLSVNQVKFDSTDLPMLVKAIHSFNWSEKNYLARKISFINKLGNIANKESADLLIKIYHAADDTIQIQNAAIEALLKQRNQYAYNLFREIIITEPPVIDQVISNYTFNPPNSVFNPASDNLSGISNGNFLDELYDSLLLTRTILPDMLNLLNLDDYKWPIMRLLKTMLDSNLVQAKDYESYFNKFYIEARQAAKKQAIEEKKSAIEKAEADKKVVKTVNYFNKNDADKGNESLIVYATLLLPFQHSKPGVTTIINELLSSGDKRLKYNTFHLLLKTGSEFPDSLLNYFAGQDEYRYELYADLKGLNKLEKFPAMYNNHRDLARSKLLSLSVFSKPDSLLFIDSLPVTFYNKKGLIYFYKYKLKKDDSFWKLASAGLIPVNKTDFLFDDETGMGKNSGTSMNLNTGYYQEKKSEFTEFADIKLKEDEPIKEQLEKQLKKILYSKRKSGVYFYSETPDLFDAMSRRQLGFKL